MNTENESLEYLSLNSYTQGYVSEAISFLETKLELQIKQRLKDEKIFLNVSSYPASLSKNIKVPDFVGNSTINIINIDSTISNLCKFTQHEIAAIILHEIGHIFNCYKVPLPKKSIIDVLQSNDLSGYNEIQNDKIENLLLKEYYADYFVKSQGCKDELITGFNKYLNSKLPFALEKKDEFDKRIEKLNSTEIFRNEDD